MADKTKSAELFGKAMNSAIAVEKSKRGLGNMFHEAVILLLNENPAATGEELVVLFRETLAEVENALLPLLKETFGDDAEAKDLSAWTQYKSNYKRALETVDRRDIMKCTGPGQMNTKLQEVRKAVKEKAEGGASTDSNPADNGATHGGAGSKVGEVSPSIQAVVDKTLHILAGLDEKTALEVVEHFHNAAAARLRKLSHGKKKFGAAAGNGNGNAVTAVS